MRWQSASLEFGFLSPEDGSRDIFVRFPTTTESDLTTHQHYTGASDGATNRQRRSGSHVTPYALESRVEVRTRYERGHWAGGYEIAEIVQSGYHVRRPGSLDVLPSIFVPADVRHAGDLK
jgi:hypothetical protein